MEKFPNKRAAAIQPTVLQKAKPPSLCSVFIRKICATPSGDKCFGMATGFQYRDLRGQAWLVTNWHVLTNRRPDNAGVLLAKSPQSPYRIEVTFPGPKVGAFLSPVSLDLYQDGKPIWYEYEFSKGIDLVAIPVNPPEGAIAPCIQDFADRDVEALVPGTDVVIIGYPFEHSIDMPFPVWKKAMVASEPAYVVFGVPQVLLDTPGVPGMSGSPVFRMSAGFSLPLSNVENFNNGISALDKICSLDAEQIKSIKMLTWIGVYSGSVGSSQLEQLALGRMFSASLVDLIVQKGELGQNEFKPEYFPA